MHTAEDDDNDAPIEPEGAASGGGDLGNDPTADDGSADADSPSGTGLEDLLPQSGPVEGTAQLP
jgi:hypothetical protein